MPYVVESPVIMKHRREFTKVRSPPCCSKETSACPTKQSCCLLYCMQLFLYLHFINDTVGLSASTLKRTLASLQKLSLRLYFLCSYSYSASFCNEASKAFPHECVHMLLPTDAIKLHVKLCPQTNLASSS